MIPRCLRVGRAAFHATTARPAASRFLMPAMSPTMTEGNITSWKMKEGDAFAAGDVILEIETDKATMDVEAQDDGVLAKIVVGDGQKGVKVGTNIAVLAEPGDDLASLEMPASKDQPTPSSEAASKSKDKETKEMENERPARADRTAKQETPKEPAKDKASTHGLTNKDGSALSPAVQFLLRHYGFSQVAEIPATGPRGRLVKGDILAFAKQIGESSNKEVADAYAKRGKLDLSNIKKAPQAAPRAAAAEAEAPAVKNPVVELRKQVDLSELILLSEKLTEQTGIDVTIESLAAKAASRALQDVPAFGLSEPSRHDSLFEEIVSGSPRRVFPEPQPLMRQRPSGIELNAAQHYGGGAIKLPSRAPQSSLFTLQAASPAPGPPAAAHFDILDFLSDVPRAANPRVESQASGSESCMLASLSFNDGSVNPKIASIYLDRVAQYVENPSHLLL